MLGNRFSCQNYYGHWNSDELSNPNISLLTNGGIIGICDDAPLYKGKEISLETIGALKDNNGIINIYKRNSNIKLKQIDKPLIFVCATSGETGKTTVAKSIIKHIKNINPNINIAGLKLSGTGCMEDILDMKDAGADEIGDLCDIGLPSSYDDYEKVRLGIFRLFSLEKFNKTDLFVCEFGGDFTGGNVHNVLQDSEIMKNVKRIILTYYDIAGLICACDLFKKWRINLEKIYVAHNIFRNISAMNQRMKEWNIPFKSFDVNYHKEEIRLSKNILKACF